MIKKGRIMKTMQEALLKWYIVEQRRLPWRETKDPYLIWLSEIMCQQTQVATVISYYNRFVERYPTVYDLAVAKEDDVYKLWEGLGYYSRAARLMLCAKVIVEQYDGQFPKSYKEMIRLPGIGPYTAGAILSIAFNIKEPAIDGNVMRVYARLYKLEEDIGKAQARKVFDSYVRRDLPEDVCHYNQGIMELGARICTPTKPECNICPIVKWCQAKKEQLQNILPIKQPKPKKKHKKMIVAYIECEGRILLEKRGTKGLLANLWGFPIVEAISMDDVLVEDYIEETYGIRVTNGYVSVKKKHVFTHLIWDMTCVHYTTSKTIQIDNPEVEWVLESDINRYPLPVAFTKLLKK